MLPGQSFHRSSLLETIEWCSCQHISAWISYFVPTLKQKAHSKNQCNLTSPPKWVTVWVEWDMPCLVPGSTTLPLLIGKAGVSFADLFGLCHHWIQTHQPWHCKAIYLVPFFWSYRRQTCLILEKCWNGLAHPFEFVRVGKWIIRLWRHCGN